MRQQEQERLLRQLIATDAASVCHCFNTHACSGTSCFRRIERYVYDVEITNTSTGTVTRVIEEIITTRPNVTTS